MKVLFTLEILLLLIALSYVVRVFWPVRAQVFNGDEEIIVSIRNRHNLKICLCVIVAMTMLLILH
ncbi:hypothetical protein ACFQAV_12455 [Companilactobacillus huachuanensis]|uniref:Nickel ABC transporter permease n=1 Tax=Companilactobacillus huachuanensis TaxID=2559914 RepID=A0ABW1RQB2_9LACO|nr:hypothetical protein [Companilactobacillus huachuanensis]